MTPRAPAPWWLWPALAAAVAGGALAMQLLTPMAPASKPAASAMPAPLPPVAASSPSPRTSTPGLPGLLAVVTVDGVPGLALVGGEPPRLVRPGELLPGGAAVLAVEERALVVRAAGSVVRLPLAGPVVALASAASASTASAAPAMPPPGYGAMPMPPQPDERVGSGNAAFRAAVEEKARSMRK